MSVIKLNNLKIGLDQPLTIIAGPCVIENEPMILETAERLLSAVKHKPVQLIFKSSYKKANRTSLSGYTGIDFVTALDIFEKVKKEYDLPVLSDVHTEMEIPVVAEVVDVLQIPAFLCRQTELLLAAGRSGKPVNIKKGQFLYPGDMEKAAEKVSSTGNGNIMFTERGTTFGYHNLVVDMRGLVIMSKIGFPVIYDATHSVQIPGGEGSESGGQPEFILPLAKAALATGAVSGVFLEVHPDPAKALSDAKSQLHLDDFPNVLDQLLKIFKASQDIRKE
jgi:2-dehydro-3-deoxyphosphooctonate aldolase (KDO 8-P synthase)